MILLQKLSLLLGDDERGLKSQFRRADQLPADVIARFTTAASGSLLLPADGSRVPLPKGGVGMMGGVYLEVDGDTRVGLDPDAADSVFLKPPAPDVPARMLLNGWAEQVVLASDTTGQAVRVQYALWGDDP